MKKLIIFGIMLSLLTGIYMSAYSEDKTTTAGKAEIKAAIAKYKQKNYLGCISDLREYVKKDPANAAAWYYLGNAYMNISMKKDAQYAFEQVIVLNTIPKLTSYAIQAKLCMETPTDCKYYNLNKKEIASLKENPAEFIKTYEQEKMKSNIKNPEETEIEKLIKGGYGNKVHPQAREVIQIEQANINRKENAKNTNTQQKAPFAKTSNASSDEGEKYARAIEMLKYNTQMESLSMMLDRPDNSYSDNYQDYLLNNRNEMTPEMVQTMMMQNMIPSL